MNARLQLQTEFMLPLERERILLGIMTYLDQGFTESSEGTENNYLYFKMSYIKYVTGDGKEFDNALDADLHEIELFCERQAARDKDYRKETVRNRWTYLLYVIAGIIIYNLIINFIK